MAAPDVIVYGQTCPPFHERAAAAVASPASSSDNPSAAHPEGSPSARPDRSSNRLEKATSSELHFPELEGESSEDNCCELLTSLRVTLERTCAREPTRAKQQPEEQPVWSGRPSPFHGSRVPTITLGAYIQRISRFSKCSNICFVMAYSYMQRLAQANSLLRPCAQNAHRLLITAVLLSAKLMDDNIYNNSYWAKIGGVSTAELAAMELAMAQELDYRLFVGEEEIAHRLRELKVLARGSHDAKR